MYESTALRGTLGTFLDAAATVADAEMLGSPADGEWGVDQILAHVSMVNAMTIAAVYAIAAGGQATYDNRFALDPWTIRRTIGLAGGRDGLCERLRRQADALGTLAEPVLSRAELDTPVPTRLLSNGELLVDEPVPLRRLIAGLGDVELPGHTQQLLALRADRTLTK